MSDLKHIQSLESANTVIEQFNLRLIERCEADNGSMAFVAGRGNVEEAAAKLAQRTALGNARNYIFRLGLDGRVRFVRQLAVRPDSPTRSLLLGWATCKNSDVSLTHYKAVMAHGSSKWTYKYHKVWAIHGILCLASVSREERKTYQEKFDKYLQHHIAEAMTLKGSDYLEWSKSNDKKASFYKKAARQQLMLAIRKNLPKAFEIMAKLKTLCKDADSNEAWEEAAELGSFEAKRVCALMKQGNPDYEDALKVCIAHTLDPIVIKKLIKLYSFRQDNVFDGQLYLLQLLAQQGNDLTLDLLTDNVFNCSLDPYFLGKTASYTHDFDEQVLVFSVIQMLIESDKKKYEEFKDIFDFQLQEAGKSLMAGDFSSHENVFNVAFCFLMRIRFDSLKHSPENIQNNLVPFLYSFMTAASDDSLFEAFVVFFENVGHSLGYARLLLGVLYDHRYGIIPEDSTLMDKAFDAYLSVADVGPEVMPFVICMCSNRTLKCLLLHEWEKKHKHEAPVFYYLSKSYECLIGELEKEEGSADLIIEAKKRIKSAYTNALAICSKENRDIYLASIKNVDVFELVIRDLLDQKEGEDISWLLSILNAWRFFYRSNEATITDEEVSTINEVLAKTFVDLWAKNEKHDSLLCLQIMSVDLEKAIMQKIKELSLRENFDLLLRALLFGLCRPSLCEDLRPLFERLNDVINKDIDNLFIMDSLTHFFDRLRIDMIPNEGIKNLMLKAKNDFFKAQQRCCF